MITAVRKASKVPSVSMAVRTMTASPAAGPLTPSGEPLAMPTTMPPTTPAMSPDRRGAPEARAMPRQSGTATRNTTMDAGTSWRSRAASDSCSIADLRDWVTLALDCQR
jgi:hypothetical protein